METKPERKIDAKYELKTLDEVGDHFPRQDNSGRVGVDRTTIYQHWKAGRLKLETKRLFGRLLFVVPVEWQREDPRTWKLSEVYKKNKRGRKSHRARIGLE